MTTKRRHGCICTRRKGNSVGYIAYITIDGRRSWKWSRDRAVCGAWLARMMDAHPTATFDNNRAKAWETRRRNGRARQPRHVILLETTPHTATYHIFVKHDWPRPRKVVTFCDIDDNTPIAWIADDNGGWGFTKSAAVRRLRTLPHVEGADYTIRRKDTVRLIRTWDR